MTKKRKAAKPRDPNQLLAPGNPGEDEALGIARTVLRPTVQAATTLKTYGQSYGELDLMGLVDSLGEQTDAARGGDLGRAEAMLIAQAHTLDAIFNNLARRAAANMGEYMAACEMYLKLALRAQAQCRSTLEALAEMKQPRSVAFVGQANIAQGHQQVNNALPRAGESAIEQTELFEQSDGKRLDTGAAGAAGRADTPLEAVGTVHRTQDA